MLRPITEKFTGKRLISVLLTVVLVAMAAPCFSGKKPLPLDPAKVTLCGVVREERVEAEEEEGGPHTHLMLRLDKPVTVSADEFLEETMVGVMQVVFMGGDGSGEELSSEMKRTRLEFSGKRACITGELYHRHTTYHHTDVLIALRSIELEAKK